MNQKYYFGNLKWPIFHPQIEFEDEKEKYFIFYPDAVLQHYQ